MDGHMLMPHGLLWCNTATTNISFLMFRYRKSGSLESGPALDVCNTVVSRERLVHLLSVYALICLLDDVSKSATMKEDYPTHWTLTALARLLWRICHFIWFVIIDHFGYFFGSVNLAPSQRNFVLGSSTYFQATPSFCWSAECQNSRHSTSSTLQYLRFCPFVVRWSGTLSKLVCIDASYLLISYRCGISGGCYHDLVQAVVNLELLTVTFSAYFCESSRWGARHGQARWQSLTDDATGWCVSISSPQGSRVYQRGRGIRGTLRVRFRCSPWLCRFFACWEVLLVGWQQYWLVSIFLDDLGAE